MLQTNAEIATQDFSAIRKRIEADYNRHKSEWETYRNEALLDVRLEAGDPKLMYELYPGMMTQWQRSAIFNHVRPLLCNASGSERNTRKMVIVAPDEGGNEYTADQWSEVIFNIWKRKNVQGLISEAFYQGPCITGQSWIQIFLNFNEDPVNGDLDFDLCPQFSVFPDPNSRKADASDAAFIWRRSLITLSDACILAPDKKEQILNTFTTGKVSLRFPYLNVGSMFNKKNLIPYDEYYYRDYREVDMMIDKETGQQFDITHRTKLDIEAAISENPRLEFDVKTMATVRVCIMVNDQIVYDGPQPNRLHRYPFVRFLGYYSPDLPALDQKVQGLCRSLRDPQLHFNRRMMLTADYMEAVVSNGWIATEGTVLDIKSLFQPGPGRLVVTAKGSAPTDLTQIQPPQMPPGAFELQEFYGIEMHKTTGIFEENTGAAADERTAGVVSRMRQMAGLVAMQPLFDRLGDARLLLGDLTMDFVRNNFTAYKVKQILNGKEPAPAFYDKDFGKYQCQLEQAFDTDTQRQLELAQLMQLTELGVKLPQKTLINAAQIQNKTELLAEMAQIEQQESQLSQLQAQLQMQEIQAKIKLAESRAFSDQSQGMERMSRIPENEQFAVERAAEAKKDETQALLNFMKALKELDAHDINQVRQLIEMQQMVSAPEQVQPKPTSQRSTSWLK